ncbi:MAG: nucleotidyltransferase [Bacilli bacterium]|nr:nucleotidyltransferase [Bacilli bacterium]
MKKIGIVCEYNPFHNGHKYQLEKIREKYSDAIIIVCMSSSFTQRGELSILNKWDKTRCALNNGVNIVLELPYIYSTQSSDTFAEYAIKILNEFKIDELCFGSEDDNLDILYKVADTQINNKLFNQKVKEYLDDGINYPTALNNALKDLINVEITKPNDLLGVSYLKEIIKNKYDIKPFVIKRTNDYHDIESDSNIVSASNIRERLIKNESIKNKVPFDVFEILKDKNLKNNYFELLKYKIISEDDLNKYLDVDEGLNTRIKNQIYKSNNLEELIQNIKTKRYTYNKISRMLNHILCSFTKSENNIKDLEYIRILGFDKKGQDYLSKIKKNMNTPILNKYDTKKYKTLEIEKRVSDIYSLIYEDIIKQEIQNKPIKKD